VLDIEEEKGCDADGRSDDQYVDERSAHALLLFKPF
jgi:hypothetical protein